jgi:hypothetical protein
MGRHRTRLLCALGVSLCWAVVAWDQAVASDAMSTALRTHLQNERFGIVTSVRGLPVGVRLALQTLFRSETFELAEPGAEFQRTHAIVDPVLPIRRMVAAGCSFDHCLVYYERGGVTHTWHVALFHWRPDKTRFEFGGSAPSGLKTIEEVRDTILSGVITIDQRRF